MDSTDKTDTIILGVDPGLTATGLVLLRKGAGYDGIELLARKTLRPRSGENLMPADRLVDLGRRFHGQWLEWASMSEWAHGEPETIVVIEDPTDYNPTAHGKVRNNTALVGAAFGVLMVEIARGFRVYHSIPSQSWIPHHNGRPMKHAAARDLLRTIYPFLKGSTDDETFAGGVAMSWLRRGGLVG